MNVKQTILSVTEVCECVFTNMFVKNNNYKKKPTTVSYSAINSI